MDDLDFSEAEICQELEKLGYQNLPLQRIKEFKRGELKFKIVILFI